jgi:hypothetical protein
MPDKELPPHGVIIRCSACKNEQQMHFVDYYTKVDADFFLCMMTGGHYGNPPPGISFKKTEPGDGSLTGRSICCNAQMEGELFGYAEAKA